MLDSSGSQAASTPPRAGARLASLGLQLVVGLGLSGLFLWLAARDADLEQLQQSMARLEVGWIVAYGGILSAGHVLRLARWAALVRRLEPLPWVWLLSVAAVGMMAVFALPARLGEVVRPAWTVRGSRLTLGEVGATVVVERLADGLCMSLILLGTVALLGEDAIDPRYRASGLAAAALFGGGGVGMIALGALGPRVQGGLVRGLGRVHPRLGERLDGLLGGFLRGLRLVAQPRVAAGYAAATALIWTLSGVGIYVFFQAFGAPVGGLGPLAAFAVLSALVVGVAIPSGPGNVGIFHWAAAFGLGMFGVSESEGLLAGAILHLLVVGCNVGFGLLGWLGARAEGRAG